MDTTRTFTQKRTATDPAAYVRQLNEVQRQHDPAFLAEIVSIDGETKSGRKQYTLRITTTR